MRIYIMTDLEGVAMVSRPEQAGWNGDNPSKQVSMKLLTAEVSAAIDGILDVSPQAEVVVWDGHGNSGIDVVEFHPAAKLISRGPIRAPFYLDSSFDAVFFVGQHAMAGTPGANLCHTYSSESVEYYRLNGVTMGEFGVRAAMAGELGVPTVFISGDDRAVAEAKELIPGIFGVAVKQSLGHQLALHLAPKRARELIRQTAADACRGLGTVAPLRLQAPYELEVRQTPGYEVPDPLPPGADRLDSRTVVYHAAHIWELPNI